MDEVQIRAGRKSKGKMKPTYFWPMFGDHNEIAFTWSNIRAYSKNMEKKFGNDFLTSHLA
jgi:transposase